VQSPSTMSADETVEAQIQEFREVAQTGSATQLLSALTDLTKVQISRELLKKTNIGALVNKLAKGHEDENVKQTAKLVVEGWKSSINYVKKPRAEDGSLQRTMSQGSEGLFSQAELAESLGTTPSLDSTVSEPGQKRPASDGDGPPLKKASSVDMGSPDASPTSTPKAAVDTAKRDNIRKKLWESLMNKVVDSEKEAVIKHCADIEEELFKAYERNPKHYMDQARSIVYNLKDTKNQQFREKVLAAMHGFPDYAPDKLPFMNAELMASDEKAIARKQIREDAAAEIQTDWGVRNGMVQASGTFTCNKCKQNKTTYFQMQTRSSDEPMTTFVTCLNCHNRWKFC